MESLVANYGSDDDEDEVQPCPSEIPARRNSLFASLPRPKFAREDTWKSDFRVSDDRIINSSEPRKASETSFTAAHRHAGDTLTHRGTEKNSRLSDASEGAKVLLQKDVKPLSDGAYGAPEEDAVPFSQGNKRVSLFGVLPPPKSTSSSVGLLKSQPVVGAASKRVVEIRPVINMALLQELDDDDNIQPQVKRHASEGMASGKATGLAAILPKPKNLGSTLGSGYASGHHATLDVGASVNSSSVRSETKSSESAPQSMHESSSFSQENTSETWNNYEHFSGGHVNAPSGAWDGYSHDVGADLQDHANTVQENAASSALYLSLQESAEVLPPEDYYDVSDDFSQGLVAQDTYSTPMPSAQDHLANMLMKERRKGGKNAPLNIIEVKQADLTATKLREDQLRTTGIAFGPAYRPVSSNKDKPSKLHRRKHQIGSLYYDMKQKEMELLERRSRGNMTKSETQAKYGW